MRHRSIPPVNRLLTDERVALFEVQLGRQTLKDAVDEILQAARRSTNGVPPFDALRDALLLKLSQHRYEGLTPVINATGILLHTNLGRAPLSERALGAIADAARGYSNLEYDLDQGTRGSRYGRASGLLRAVTGAQDALVVNNCAAAVLLIADTFARGREVVVSRGELVEIGGGFRIPDVLRRAGAELVEVGSTNKTTAADYRAALSARTGLLLRTHTSNYRMDGFTESPDPAQLAALARAAGIPLAEDLGSGALADLAEYGLPHERTVQEALADGMDLVAFSGDKVLGGPQAGIIVGRSTFIGRLANNPLIRALRVDKLTLAALSETLRCYATPEDRLQIPFFAMLSASLEQLRERARAYAAALPGASVADSVAFAGGGTLPQAAVPSVAVVPALGLRKPSDVLQSLRMHPHPVIARIENGSVLLDLRTIAPHEDARAIAALRAVLD